MTGTILVVEDDETSRNMLAYLLDKAGYQVRTAGDGREALEQSRSQHPDLIVMDVQMPVLDGYQAARECKNDPALHHIPIVAVTAVAMVGDREKVFAAGFDAYITKPIVPEEVVAQIETMLPADRRAHPVAQAPSAGHAVHAAQAAMPLRSESGRVLVIDDREDNLKLMGLILEPAGYEVDLASSAPEAVAAARATPPDLIISDIHLADGTGYELLDELRLDPVLSAIPVVLISSSLPYGPPGQRHIAMGARDLIVRPIDPSELLARVAVALGKAGS